MNKILKYQPGSPCCCRWVDAIFPGWLTTGSGAFATANHERYFEETEPGQFTTRGQLPSRNYVIDLQSLVPSKPLTSDLDEGFFKENSLTVSLVDRDDEPTLEFVIGPVDVVDWEQVGSVYPDQLRPSYQYDVAAWYAIGQPPFARFDRFSTLPVTISRNGDTIGEIDLYRVHQIEAIAPGDDPVEKLELVAPPLNWTFVKSPRIIVRDEVIEVGGDDPNAAREDYVAGPYYTGPLGNIHVTRGRKSERGSRTFSPMVPTYLDEPLEPGRLRIEPIDPAVDWMVGYGDTSDPIRNSKSKCLDNRSCKFIVPYHHQEWEFESLSIPELTTSIESPTETGHGCHGEVALNNDDFGATNLSFSNAMRFLDFGADPVWEWEGGYNGEPVNGTLAASRGRFFATVVGDEFSDPDEIPADKVKVRVFVSFSFERPGIIGEPNGPLDYQSPHPNPNIPALSVFAFATGECFIAWEILLDRWEGNDRPEITFGVNDIQEISVDDGYGRGFVREEFGDDVEIDDHTLELFVAKTVTPVTWRTFPYQGGDAFDVTRTRVDLSQISIAIK